MLTYAFDFSTFSYLPTFRRSDFPLEAWCDAAISHGKATQPQPQPQHR
jgi:hypothetical protein